MSAADPWGIREELHAARAEVADLRREVAALVTRLNVEPLQPLATILGCSPRAALGRLANDSELRALGHRLGRRLVFRPSEVRHLLASRK